MTIPYILFVLLLNNGGGMSSTRFDDKAACDAGAKELVEFLQHAETAPPIYLLAKCVPAVSTDNTVALRPSKLMRPRNGVYQQPAIIDEETGDVLMIGPAIICKSADNGNQWCGTMGDKPPVIESGSQLIVKWPQVDVK